MEHDKTALDRLLIYRNLLCVEDHIDELRSSADYDSLKQLESTKKIVEELRDNVMPKEANSLPHCIVKHLSAAYEGAREVAKETKDPDDDVRATILRDLLFTYLEKLWGYKPELCERCGNEHSNESK